MRLHPDDAVERAIDRDLRDDERLSYLETVITECLDRIALDASPLEHPRIRWQPGDLVDALTEQLSSLRHERRHLRGPVFVEECD